MRRLLVIAVGGVLGALARYGIDVVLEGAAPAGWPWATLTVNVLGCLAIGLVAARAHSGAWWVHPLTVTGFLGGFTTFSAFGMETGLLLDSGHYVMATTYVVVTLVAGLFAVHLGRRIAAAGAA